MKKIILFGAIFTTMTIANAQIIERYGLRIGGGMSNQYWDFTNDSYTSYSQWEENKFGLSFYFNAEKKISKFFSMRPEIGYQQSGFSSKMELTDETGKTIDIQTNKITFHNLSSNIGFKITPINTRFMPYIIAGIRANYLLAYNESGFMIGDRSYTTYNTLIDKFNKLILSGLIGLGFEYNNLIYVDLEYTPAITKTLNDKGLTITDRYYGMTLGINIKQLIRKKE